VNRPFHFALPSALSPAAPTVAVPSVPVLSIAAFLTLCSCDALEGKLKIIQGNFFFSRAMYNEAISAYMAAQNDPDAAPYAAFALGTVYLVLEQDDAALARFNQAGAAPGAFAGTEAGRRLLYNIAYNKGIIMFQKGNFAAACGNFRTALSIKNSAIGAKRNLELSLLALYMKNKSPDIQERGLGAVAEDKDNMLPEIIFDFVRRKEVDNWKSLEWAGPEDEQTPDY